MRQILEKILAKVVASADIIITSCYLAANDNMIRKFQPRVAIIDGCHQLPEGEAMAPLLLYKEIQFRIIVGDKAKSQPFHEELDDTISNQAQPSLLERMAMCGVPVHELKRAYPLESDSSQGSREG